MDVTSKEQGGTLLALGVSIETSDCFFHDDVLHIGNCAGMTYPNVSPAWSCEALINLFPFGTLFLSSSRLGWTISFTHSIFSTSYTYELNSRNKLISALFDLYVYYRKESEK